MVKEDIYIKADGKLVKVDIPDEILRKCMAECLGVYEEEIDILCANPDWAYANWYTGFISGLRTGLEYGVNNVDNIKK